MKKKYVPPPFNFCDYRCDRCEHKDACKVCKEDQERILDHYVKGEDPNDPDIFLNDIQKIFAKTKNMLQDMAKKQGIEIDQVKDEASPDVNPEEYVIYRLAHEYYREAHALIAYLENSGIPESLDESFTDLIWYHTLIAAKTGRLVSGFIDDFLDDDLRKIEEEGTLGVIHKSIALSKDALEVMLGELPDHLHDIAHLMDVLKRIERQIQKGIREKVQDT
jgi:hypothetical protein